MVFRQSARQIMSTPGNPGGRRLECGSHAAASTVLLAAVSFHARQSRWATFGVRQPCCRIHRTVGRRLLPRPAIPVGDVWSAAAMLPHPPCCWPPPPSTPGNPGGRRRVGAGSQPAPPLSLSEIVSNRTTDHLITVSFNIITFEKERSGVRAGKLDSDGTARGCAPPTHQPPYRLRADAKARHRPQSDWQPHRRCHDTDC